MIDPSDSHDARTRIKICGITSADLAHIAADAGADAVGLVLAADSPRCISWEKAEAIAETLDDDCVPVSVFCNHPIERVERWPGPVVQLHGDEDPEYVTELHRRRPELLIIKGFQYAADAVRTWDECAALHAMLIDGSTGGHGQAFNHLDLAPQMPHFDTPVILAGGLNAANVADAIRIVGPFAVDVSSGVETERGVKDVAKIRAFCTAVHVADEVLREEA